VTESAPYLTDAANQRFPLSERVTTLGRSEHCQVFIPDRRASRRHAEIDFDGETCTVRDLGSDNGTFVNGRRLDAPHTLCDGDEIGLASAVFTFHDPEATLRVAEWPQLVVDLAGGEIWINRQRVSLSVKEQALFDLLYRNADRICDPREIAAAVWPEYQSEAYDYQIERLVKRLREKIEPDARHPVLILTARGRGYKFVLHG
jgi:DNA-binding response OmpR family regulator